MRSTYLNFLVSVPAVVSGLVVARQPSFILQTGTALEETEGNFQILVGDYNRDRVPDLVAIKTSNTGSKSTEIHVLSGASTYKNFILQTGTGLGEAPASQFKYLLADYDGDGKLDLIAIKKYATGTSSTEVHILSGASNYQKFILQTGTALHETDDTWSFGVGNWDTDSKPDIFAIKKSNTGSKSTEVHILRGSADYKNFVLQTGTALSETDSTWNFAVGDWNGDGKPDLIGIKKESTGTASTEIHVLTGANNFQNFILQTGTALHPTGANFEFGVADYNRDGKLDLFAFKKSNTGSLSTEVHVLSG
ncbi:FG-GAP repeat domain-containing protein [Pyrenochaeta sp. DS3sAY3a]|nr:FG-GAP repeat domain-containing protein [Pyrenochaeta sp. DS3sAY3a]